MTNNDVLRRIRYTLNFDDTKMIAIFALADLEVTRAEISDWLKKDDDPDFKSCKDVTLATFLNGLIIDKRGRKDGPQPVPETTLTNNIIFRKLKIALNLKSTDIIAMMQLAGYRLSSHELSSFMRRPGHRNYRECKDQVLRNFLKGLQLHLRGEQLDKPDDNSPYAKWTK